MDEYTVMNVAVGTRYLDRRFTCQAAFYINYIPITGDGGEEATYKAAVQGSVKSKRMKHTGRASVFFAPKADTYTVFAGYSITAAGKRERITGDAKLEAAQSKSGADTLTASVSAKATITHRPLRVILKVGIESVVAASE